MSATGYAVGRGVGLGRERAGGGVTKMNVLELFGGIGACTAALKRLEIPFEVVDYVEINKYAVKSYNAMNGTNFEPQDITKWDKDIEVDLVMHGSPCQDFSIAGKQAGGDEESGTRSSLMYETIRIVEKLKPKYVIWENVKNLLSKKHKHNFDAYCEKLETLGYKNYYQVLNAKDYGVPQNRERVFTISILDNTAFKFPRKFPLELKLKDVLEDEVDEKFYLTETCIKGFIKHRERHEAKGSGFIWKPRNLDGVASCLRANGGLAPTGNTIIADPKVVAREEPKCIQVGQMYGTEREPNPQAGRIYSSDGISPTMDTCGGGNRMPKILVKNATKKGYAEATEGDSINLEQPNSKTRRGRVGKGVAQTLTTSCNQAVVVGVAMRGRENGQQIEISDREYSNALTTVPKNALVVEKMPGAYRKDFGSKGKKQDANGVCNTLQAAMGEGGGNVPYITETKRIRKLTPKECWRLMGFDDEDFEKAEKVNSNTQLYKQAGNSIVVDVLVYVFKNLLMGGSEEVQEEQLEMIL